MKKEEKKFFNDILMEIKNSEKSQFDTLKDYIQHGKISVYRHSIMVAYHSYKLVCFLGLKVDKRSLIRGALLHDYFLYDWHDGKSERRIHGFTHPSIALKNAQRDFELNDKEKNIIKSHMFPLTFTIPKSLEAIIVCLVDKYLSSLETLER